MGCIRQFFLSFELSTVGLNFERIRLAGYPIFKIMRSRFQLILLLTSVTMAVACDQNRQTSPSQPRSPGAASGMEKLKQDAKDAVTSSKAYLIQQKEQLEKNLGDKMTDFEKRISELKTKSVRAGDRAKSEWSDTLIQLQQKKQVAAEKF